MSQTIQRDADDIADTVDYSTNLMDSFSGLPSCMLTGWVFFLISGNSKLCATASVFCRCFLWKANRYLLLSVINCDSLKPIFFVTATGNWRVCVDNLRRLLSTYLRHERLYAITVRWFCTTASRLAGITWAMYSAVRLYHNFHGNRVYMLHQRRNFPFVLSVSVI